MGTDWTRQTGGFTEDLPRSLETPRIWDEQRTGTVGAGPLTRTCPISPRSWEDPQGDCRKRYQLIWKRNSIVSQMEIRVLNHASVSCFGPGRASALSPLGSLSWSVSALWPSYCQMQQRPVPPDTKDTQEVFLLCSRSTRVDSALTKQEEERASSAWCPPGSEGYRLLGLLRIPSIVIPEAAFFSLEPVEPMPWTSLPRPRHQVQRLV